MYPLTTTSNILTTRRARVHKHYPHHAHEKLEKNTALYVDGRWGAGSVAGDKKWEQNHKFFFFNNVKVNIDKKSDNDNY